MPLNRAVLASLLLFSCDATESTASHSTTKAQSGQLEDPQEPGKAETYEAGEYIEEFEFEMVPVKAGSFTMGSAEDEVGRDPDETQHEVTLSQDFMVSKIEVTQALYESIMETRPWASREKREDHNETERLNVCDSIGNQASADDQPAYCVTWDEAIQFCNKLSVKEGLTPVYRVLGGRDVEWNAEADGYRLLSEAEWEYAARAGQDTLYSGADLLGKVAWFTGNADGKTHPTGTKMSNAWGIHDMSGNVQEWVWDWYNPHTADAATDPKGGLIGEGRVIRTSSFCHGDSASPLDWDRISSRESMRASWSSDWTGFRVARSSMDL